MNTEKTSSNVASLDHYMQIAHRLRPFHEEFSSFFEARDFNPQSWWLRLVNKPIETSVANTRRLTNAVICNFENPQILVEMMTRKWLSTNHLQVHVNDELITARLSGRVNKPRLYYYPQLPREDELGQDNLKGELLLGSERVLGEVRTALDMALGHSSGRPPIYQSRATLKSTQPWGDNEHQKRYECIKLALRDGGPEFQIGIEQFFRIHPNGNKTFNPHDPNSMAWDNA